MAGDDTAHRNALHDRRAIIGRGLNCTAAHFGPDEMTQTEATGEPIGVQDLDQLEELADAWVEHGGMPLEALDGFFSALVVGPGSPVPANEFLPVAMGGGSPGAASGEAGQGVDLLMKLWSHVAWRVRQPLPGGGDAGDHDDGQELAIMPIIGLPSAAVDPDAGEGDADPLAGIPDDFPLGALWASGFMQGVAMREQDWERWMQDDEDLLADLRDIALLGVVDPAQAEAMGLDWEDRFDLEERWELMASIPLLLQDLYLSGGEPDQAPTLH